MTLLYFAYGSNMSSARLRARVPSARAAGIGRLPAHGLRWHMQGSDGSGKCSIESTGQDNDAVWGVLFTFDAAERHHLDRAEGLGVAYAAERTIILAGDAAVEAFTYRALRVAAGLQPFHWYREFVVHGAREHGLPLPYRQQLEAVPFLTDPDAERAALNASILARHDGR